MFSLIWIICGIFSALYIIKTLSDNTDMKDIEITMAAIAAFIFGMLAMITIGFFKLVKTYKRYH